MSITFTKLFSSITESTIWSESSDIRVVWITMLAMADRRGRIWSSIPGLANRSQVNLEQTEIALQKFLSPDTYSRTKDLEGRRIEIIDGGWRLLNHEKYRSLRDDEERKIYKRDWIKNKRSVDNVDTSRPQYTKAEADTEAVVISSRTDTVSGKPDDGLREKNKKIKSEAIEALKFLNQETGKAFREVESNLKPIESILKSGIDLQDVKTVTMRKIHDWSKDPKMAEYLRPATLYRRSNFEQYYGHTMAVSEER